LRLWQNKLLAKKYQRRTMYAPFNLKKVIASERLSKLSKVFLFILLKILLNKVAGIYIFLLSFMYFFHIAHLKSFRGTVSLWSWRVTTNLNIFLIWNLHEISIITKFFKWEKSFKAKLNWWHVIYHWTLFENNSWKLNIFLSSDCEK